MKIKCVLFGLGDTLYDASMQVYMARINAVRAMLEAGIPLDFESTFNALKSVVSEHGEDFDRHFDLTLQKLGVKRTDRVVAAAITAYHDTKSAFLKPFPETIPTLLALRDRRYSIGVISYGRPVKEWEKLVRLGLQHLFHYVVVNDGDKLVLKNFQDAFESMNVEAAETIFVGARLQKEIKTANEAEVVSVRIRRGEARTEEPSTSDCIPKFEIGKLSEMFSVIRQVERKEAAEEE
ncbi:MAG: HAD family hydrolase [Promethearchaeati archaeon SRVP18_Atabeyarchaeia-1]